MLISYPDINDRLTVPMHMGMWHGNETVDLTFPSTWDVRILCPDTPTEMTPSEICAALERPIAQPPLRTLCRGAKRPLIIIDDVNRPTPVALILPFVLAHFADAGIPAKDITIVLATGTHAEPEMTSVLKKVGHAAETCRIVVHNSRTGTVRMGRTSFGTPVVVNKEVAGSDFVIGIGGVYPNSTAGYGGGSKLSLGVLGFSSILALHYFHRAVGRGIRHDHAGFREDLNEIADILKIRSIISAHVNARCGIVRLVCGDFRSYYPKESAFAQNVFTMPGPGDANVVISNAFPSDVSLTFALMKGAVPLHACQATSSRVLVAQCSEGIGGHGIFPVVNVPRFHSLKNYLRLASVRPVAFTRKACAVASKRLRRRAGRSPGPTMAAFENPVRLYLGPAREHSLPTIAGVTIMESWPDVLSAIQREQNTAGPRLKVVVYPCAPLVALSH